MKTIFAALILCILTFNLSAEERTFLGVETNKPSKDVQSQLGLKSNSGHTVLKVLPGSPAEKSGLKQNDIIYSIDGKIIKNHISIKKYIESLYESGDEINIEYYRKGSKESVKSTLTSKDLPESAHVIPAGDQQKAVQDIMKQLQKGGLSNLLKNGGGVSTMMVDGEHRIAVSGGAVKHVKVTNTNTSEVEFEGDIKDNDFSDVPSDLRPKVEKAITMLSGLNLGNFSGKSAPKAKDDSAEKVDEFIKEIEKKKTPEENSKEEK